MTISAPPRPSGTTGDHVDRQEVEALVEALFEEARQRARRRRRARLAIVACVVLVGGSALAVFERSAESQNSAAALTAAPTVSGGKVKVVIAGTNDSYDVRDGSLAGIGTFKASGFFTDAGKALAYRTVSPDGTLITLRYVAKGKKGTITYVVKIDTNTGTSRWTIASGTKAYKGLHGKGIETENGSYTVSILRGTVSG
jgi:hypothetical protein